ncbi:endonuclease/exonuclease/phosphatase family protein [Salegentibacter sediminis]|uniref:endonuclease/exonuclease/phosphatase family protein n=1 Tax=Salegentibacter sediminis TaxID=1930251 RepID=UPI0009BF34FE|nr:endonuclease/exonuclease/phosphatase family protein [Salegentibacter sediminis]
MKKLSFLDKIVFILNSLAATALLLSYLLPFIPPKSFPLLSVLSLGVPVLIILNIVFLIFWILKFKRQFLLSLIVLLLGFNYVTGLYQFSAEEGERNDDQLSVMSYNVRMFNAYNWVDEDDIPEKITGFVNKQAPDILAMQEYYVGASGLRRDYPYYYIKLKNKNDEFGSAIFSKYPIINRYSLDFPQQGNNNATYVDIVIEKDTLRVFNVHFQSLNIKPQIDELQKEDSRKLLGRIGAGFAMQQEQAEMLIEEVNNSPYKTLIIGDFNNTIFSYIYEKINPEKRFQDAFLEAGSGFGETFKLSYFPLRIDFLLIEDAIEIQSYERFKVEYSDHYPIMTRLQL